MYKDDNIETNDVNANVVIPGWGTLPAKNLKDEIEARIFNILVQVKNKNFNNVYYDLFQNPLLETFLVAQLGSVEKNPDFYCSKHESLKDLRETKFKAECGDCLQEHLDSNMSMLRGGGVDC